MKTQQQSITTRKKWNIKHGRSSSPKWGLPENRSKTRKWGLLDPTAVFMATFRENAKVEHDCQTPENSEPVKRREIRPNEPTAFCHNCQEMTPMIWLPKEERGKNCDTWFKCEFCGGRHLTIKYITEKKPSQKISCQKKLKTFDGFYHRPPPRGACKSGKASKAVLFEIFASFADFLY